jgi:adenosylcobinamide-phosphate synthase
MVLSAIIIWLSIAVDRLLGDPPNRFHPTAYLGRFIGWWGIPSLYPQYLERAAGVVGMIVTAFLFTAPFVVFAQYAPFILLIIGTPVLLKLCFAWRCLEEHVTAVRSALATDLSRGREEVRMLVSRETSSLSGEEILSAAYESMSENLVDSIVSPLFYFALFGLGGAAFFRAVNTADAMLGYRDERIRIGWFAARLDDLLGYIPARAAGFLLLCYFWVKGRAGPAYATLIRDAKKRAGFNGGIPLAIIAGGVGVVFEKPGVYTIGDGPRTIEEAGGQIVSAVRAVTIAWAALLSGVMVLITLYF